jgi:hypothetical protein
MRKIFNILSMIVVRLCTIILFLFLLCGLMTVFFSCSSSKRNVSDIRSDSVRIEYRTEYVEDTIYYTLPYIHDGIVNKDSTSTIENRFAVSIASIRDGLLFHSLETKPQDILVPIKSKIEHRDSIVYKTKNHTEYIYITKSTVPLMYKIAIVITILIIFVLLFVIIKSKVPPSCKWVKLFYY